jgi:glycosyltransferase involved in cell wall biosynthesis
MADRRPRYYTVEWSGGGGWGHYAWLLADALAASWGSRSVLLTREGHELGATERQHSVRTVWRAAPTTRTRVPRRARVAQGWLWGWIRVAFTGVRERLSRRRSIFHIHGYEGVLPALVGLVLRASGQLVVVTVHNPNPHDSGRIARRFAEASYRIPDGLVAHTPDAAISLGRLCPPSVVVTTIPHPTYADLAGRFGVRPRGAARSDTVTIGVLGHIKPYKDLPFVVAVLGLLMKENPRVRVRVAGHPADRLEVERCLSRLPTDRLTARLEYLGLEELIREVTMVDVLFLGHRSLSESGIGHLALGVGVPVIGPRVGAIAAMLAGEPDWLFPPGAVGPAVTSLERVISSYSTAPGGPARALSLAASSMTWARSAGLHSDLVEGLAGRSARRR